MARQCASSSPHAADGTRKWPPFSETLAGYRRAGLNGRQPEKPTQKLDIVSEAKGRGHDQYAALLNNLAHIDEQVGDLAVAQARYEESLKLTRSTLGEHHPEVGTCIANLAFLLARRGRFNRALELPQ